MGDRDIPTWIDIVKDGEIASIRTSSSIPVSWDNGSWTHRLAPREVISLGDLAGLLARAEDEAEQAADRLAWLRRAMKRMLVGPSCDELEAAAAKDCS